jgi:GNAT superfamily N-acetyltransferase
MFTIRDAYLRDIDMIVELRMKLLFELGKLEKEDGTAKLQDATRSYFINKIQAGEFRVWIAENAGQIIGMTCIQFIEHPPVYENINGIEAHVMDVYTVKEFRGQGIAKAILLRIIDYAKEKKAKRVVLNTLGADKRIYEKLGFISITNEMELFL